eukprot:g1655.t1
MSTTEEANEASFHLLREHGNQAFRNKDYRKAVDLYSDCLLLSPTDHQLLSNRSAVYLELGYLEDAYQDAKECVSLSGSYWPKAHYRLGNVLIRLERWSAAVEAFKTGLALDPTNTALRKKVVISAHELETRSLRLQSQLAMFRRDAIFRLKRSRQAEAKEALIAQYKESMTCPNWELEEYEWRPTFLSSMKLERTCSAVFEEDSCSKILMPFLKSLSDLATPKDCIEILMDGDRLEFYEQELKSAIASKSGCHVVVVGYWSCILGLIAAKNGAEKVTCIEQCQSMYNLTKAVLEVNKALLCNLCPIDVLPVDVYHSTGSQTVSEEDHQRIFVQEADVFVSDLFDHSVLDCGILKVLDHARKEFLKKDCVVIPSAVEISATMVDTTMSKVSSFDFSCLDKYQWHLHHQKLPKKRRTAYKQLTSVFQLLRIDFQNESVQETPLDFTVSTVIKQSQEILPLTSYLQFPLGGTFNGVLTGLKLEGSPHHGRALTSWTTDLKGDSLTHRTGSSISLGLQYIDGLKINTGNEIALKVFQDDCLFYVSILNSEECIPRHALLPNWHFDMLRDSVRNQFYQEAIQSAIELKQESSASSEVHVLDAGAGSGLLSLIAANSGASRISAVEYPGHISDLCEETVITNGLFSRIQVIPKAIKAVSESDLGTKADILAMEVFDCGLIGEGALHIIHSVWKELMKHDAVMVPCGAALYVQPMQLNRVSKCAGFDVSIANAFRWRPEYEEINLGDENHNSIPLGHPCKAFSFDFYQIEECLENQKSEMEFTATQSGILNAVVFWFELFLDDERTLSTSPYDGNSKSTWGQAVQWLQEREVVKGTRIYLLAKHDTNGFSFEVLNKDLRETGIPLVDPSWKAKFEITQSMNTALVIDY